MAKKHFTANGDQIDMAALAARHSDTVALGNARMNARGDILGDGGVVLRTQEQIDEEWRRNRELRDSSVGISPDIKAPFLDPQQNVMQMEDRDFDPGEPVSEPPVSPPPRRRKIVDAD